MVKVGADGERGVRHVDEKEVGEGDSRERRRGVDLVLQRINMGGGGGDGDALPSGDGEGYRWEQTEDGEVEISVYVPENTKAKTFRPGLDHSCVVKDKTNDNKIIVQIDNLYSKVRPDECTWTIAGGSKKNEVCVSLAKSRRWLKPGAVDQIEY